MPVDYRPSSSHEPLADCDDVNDVRLQYSQRASQRRRLTAATPQRVGNGRKRLRWEAGGDGDDEEEEEEENEEEEEGTGAPSETSADASTSSSTTGGSKNRPHLSESDVASRCFTRGNHIYYFSGVSKDSVYRLKNAIQKLNDAFRDTQREHPHLTMTPAPIYLHINSFGGGVFAAFAAIDFIQQSAIPIHTIIEGASASAATLMSVVGAKRYMRPTASMLIHELSSWFGGKLTAIEDDYQNLQQMHETIKRVYKKHTKLREAELGEILAHDRWWNIDKCLEVGLVDAVWTGEDE